MFRTYFRENLGKILSKIITKFMQILKFLTMENVSGKLATNFRKKFKQI